MILPHSFMGQFREQYQMLDLMIDMLFRVSVADGALSPSEERLIFVCREDIQFR